MAKTIKFNLILDGYPVRNIEGLQEHFSIEDMLKYYENCMLLRWLKVRGFEKEYAAVAAMVNRPLDKKEIVMELVKIFEISEMDSSEIEKAICILTYLEDENRANAVYKENAFEKKKIINDYHSGYKALIEHMKENKENMALLKAYASQMEKEYYELFKLEHEHLYFRLAEDAPKAVFALLTIDAFRKFWIGDCAHIKVLSNIKTNLLQTNEVKKILGDDLRIVKRNTQAMWDSIVTPDKKVMVISIASGTFIKNAGNFSEKLSADDVNHKLVKLNGLEYQCNNESLELLYMEV